LRNNSRGIRAIPSRSRRKRPNGACYITRNCRSSA
jgi:hypothetical protein